LTAATRWRSIYLRQTRIERRASMEGIRNTPAETPVSLSIINPDIVIRSWKDARYRRSLSAQQLQALPNNPAGPAALTDAELRLAAGLASEEDAAVTTPFLTTALGCTEWTFHNWKACGC
jgi:mersacidin/lichenicidin family type 2 lantibiotic